MRIVMSRKARRRLTPVLAIINLLVLIAGIGMHNPFIIIAGATGLAGAVVSAVS
jgi:hypothetical protein